MPYVTITIDEEEFADANYLSKLILYFPKTVTVQNAEEQPGEYVLKSAFSEKILSLLKEEVRLNYLQLKNEKAVAVKELYPPEQILLSIKEKEVLNLLSKGYSYKMIAHELGKSIETIRVQIKSIYRKLKVCSNTQAVIKSMDEKLF